MKKILVVHYSQTGQLDSVMRSVTGPLEAAEDIEVHYEDLRPVKDYPFPWGMYDFVNVFPECVYQDPPAMRPFGFDPATRYDLIIIAYSVWFLSPSLPITGFLQSEEAARVMKDTPVVTLTACRNMWLQAQEKVKARLNEVGAKHSDHIALVDRGNSLQTLVTTPRWLWTGRRNAFWGIFPKAGIAEEDITAAARFGHALRDALRANRLTGEAPVLTGLKAAPVDERLIDGERIILRSYMTWGRWVRRRGAPDDPRRRPILRAYIAFMFAIVLTVVPITVTIRTLLRPFQRERIAAARAYFEQPSGADTARMDEYR
ncbi:dialkylrecorsinol condensing enzyme [Alkalilimnicola sp. S0819]|uniref:dialkylrecorsinol condensing enzyme n=1 Tax=Alkalilimnicola sp. S0819 TaxID=2613922 RepID=UPI001261549C|nr:dialkylrecorsinol condensing enzyme [Alkalilimnicola sp. S0819]KAB7624162.1 dialkylresorcinol condensing enzyme [Alkalilimnicola sp. S0819]MPQ16415.1 dialkylresorcinol condensing enzyme [Alkalilimnicola sp. S0819]